MLMLFFMYFRQIGFNSGYGAIEAVSRNLCCPTQFGYTDRSLLRIF
jgi:hypothetical protein